MTHHMCALVSGAQAHDTTQATTWTTIKGVGPGLCLVIHDLESPCICNGTVTKALPTNLLVGCRLIECLALAELPLSTAQHKQLHASINENLRHPTASIQTAACAALEAFAHTYLPASDAHATSEAVKHTTEKYLAQLQDPNVAVRRGAAAALGCLPPWLLTPLGVQVLSGLATATEVSTTSAL